MKKYIVIIALLLFALPVKAELDGPEPLNNIIHWWRVIQGNAGPIPKEGFLFTCHNDVCVMTKWDTAIMGAAQPSDATFNSYSAVSAATRLDHDNVKSADFTKWSKREKAVMKLFRKQINILRVLNSLPALSVDEFKAELNAMM